MGKVNKRKLSSTASKTKRIGGKTYTLQGITKTKKAADDLAYKLRYKWNDNARIFKVKGGYAVYSH